MGLRDSPFFFQTKYCKKIVTFQFFKRCWSTGFCWNPDDIVLYGLKSYSYRHWQLRSNPHAVFWLVCGLVTGGLRGPASAVTRITFTRLPLRLIAPRRKWPQSPWSLLSRHASRRLETRRSLKTSDTEGRGVFVSAYRMRRTGVLHSI